MPGPAATTIPMRVRILARAWLQVIWRCWQDGVGYHPAQHRALQQVLGQDAAAGETHQSAPAPTTSLSHASKRRAVRAS